MLSDTLLDSSPAREPILHGRHWLIAVATGLAAFCLAWFGLQFVESPLMKVLFTQASILAVACFLSALMLAYVHADSKHLNLRTWPWMVLTLLLNVAGFISYLVYSAAKTNDWKRTTLPFAYMIEVIVVGVMVIVPLVHTEALPKASLAFVWMPSPPAAPPRAAASPRVPVQQVSLAELEKAPTVIPSTITMIKEQPSPPSNSVPVGGLPGVGPGGPSDEVLNSIIGMGAVPPPPPKAKPQTIQRVLRGGDVEAARLIYGPRPDYPQLARIARVQGTVRLEALIATDGTIKGLKVISGHPLLIRAALEAVEQWRYQPTLLNNQPVEVETDIDVNFTLGQ